MRRVLLVLTALLAAGALSACGASKPAPKRYGSGCGPILLHRYGCAPTPIPAFSCPSGVRCFYVAASGLDSNNGTSESTPWADAPGMQTFTGTYTHQGGDEFIFRGGDTWGHSTWPLIATGSGNATHDDYYGVDPTWHSGASWSQPTFDAGGTNIDGTVSGVTGYDVMLEFAGRDYIEVDDIHLTGFTGTSLCTLNSCSGWNGCAQIDMNTGTPSSEDQNITFDRLTVDHWSVDEYSDQGGQVSGGSSGGLGCYVVDSYGGGTGSGNSILENSTIDGFDPSGYPMWGGGIVLSYVENNTIEGMTNMIKPPASNAGSASATAGIISGNYIYGCGYPHWPENIDASGDYHADMIQIEGSGEVGSHYVYNNVFTGSDDPTSNAGAECEASLLYHDSTGANYYYYNNVFSRLSGHVPTLTVGTGTAGATNAYFWNNTLESNVSGGTAQGNCLSDGSTGGWGTVVYENTHCISDSSGTTSTGGADSSFSTHATSFTASSSNNVLMTNATASSDGYAAPGATDPFQPPGGTTPTTGTGVNLASDCAGQLAALCSTTSAGGTLTGSARPSSAAWNSGAY